MAQSTPLRTPVRRFTGAVIDAVLEHADTVEDLGAGKRLYRLSPKRSRTRLLRDRLGRDAARAAEVAVIWDEREDQIFKVIETAPLPRARFDENDDCWWSRAAA